METADSGGKVAQFAHPYAHAREGARSERSDSTDSLNARTRAKQTAQSAQVQRAHARGRAKVEANRDSGLTPKQQAFVDGLRQGKSMDEAAADAGYTRCFQSLRLMVARRFPQLLRQRERESTRQREALFAEATTKGLSAETIRTRMRRLPRLYR